MNRVAGTDREQNKRVTLRVDVKKMSNEVDCKVLKWFGLMERMS